MRRFTFILCSVVLALAWQTHSSLANGSLTFSVSTGGYQFTPKIGPATANLSGQAFMASASLQNNTNADIPCTLSVTGTPGERFEFRVYDSHGRVVWGSLPPVLPPLEMLATLKPGQTWQGSVAVPLFINGQALPAGTYMLEATLFGWPVFSGRTTFLVID